MRAIWAIIPVKDLSQAKQRLSGLLHDQERRALGLAMLEDVLITLGKAKGLSGVLLVSSDADACELAGKYGARILREAGSDGLNPAVTRAARLLAGEGVDGALVLHGDIPLAQAGDVDHVLAALGPAPAMAIAPDSTHDGTNALAVCPPDLITFCYGRDSFQAHLAQAAAHRIAPRILDLPSLAFDVDDVQDLIRLAATPEVARSREYLCGLDLESRTQTANCSVR
jgi:2-phospho-L-lactate guanylyltransferase